LMLKVCSRSTAFNMAQWRWLKAQTWRSSNMPVASCRLFTICLRTRVRSPMLSVFRMWDSDDLKLHTLRTSSTTPSSMRWAAAISLVFVS
jgi:hypothetical protein